MPDYSPLKVLPLLVVSLPFTIPAGVPVEREVGVEVRDKETTDEEP